MADYARVVELSDCLRVYIVGFLRYNFVEEDERTQKRIVRS